ncbi:hypothetical protein AAC387_Pa04g1636 [Persea americana]
MGGRRQRKGAEEEGKELRRGCRGEGEGEGTCRGNGERVGAEKKASLLLSVRAARYLARYQYIEPNQS